MDITNLIKQQGEIEKAIDELRKKDKDNVFLCSALISQISSRHNLMAYQMGFKPEETINSDELRREYMKIYMQKYLPKYRRRKKE